MMGTRRAFMGRMSTGDFRAAIAKVGKDASDPNIEVTDLDWTSDLATLRLLATGTATVFGPTSTPGTDAFGPWATVAIGTLVGSALILCQVKAQSRWSWVNFVTGYTVVTDTIMATGWWLPPQNSPAGGPNSWAGPRFESEINGTNVRFRCNNTGNGSNNGVDVYWAVYESR
jgi:hypothetical protein